MNFKMSSKVLQKKRVCILSTYQHKASFTISRASFPKQGEINDSRYCITVGITFIILVASRIERTGLEEPKNG